LDSCFLPCATSQRQGVLGNGNKIRAEEVELQYEVLKTHHIQVQLRELVKTVFSQNRIADILKQAY